MHLIIHAISALISSERMAISDVTMFVKANMCAIIVSDAIVFAGTMISAGREATR